MTTIQRTVGLFAVLLGAAALSGCKLPLPQDDAEDEAPIADPGRRGTPGDPPTYGGGEDPGPMRRARRHRMRQRRFRDGGPRRRWREMPTDPGDPGGDWGSPGGRRRGMRGEPSAGDE